MDKSIQLFHENITYMGNRLMLLAQQFEDLRFMLEQYPDEAYKLISEKEKTILFSTFINLNKQLNNVKHYEIKALLEKLTMKLYGINSKGGGKIWNKIISKKIKHST